MPGIKIDIIQSPVGPSVSNARRGLSGSGAQLMLADIGEYLMLSTRERAAREVSPEGTPWAPLSPRYKRRKEKKRPGVPMLRYDSHMLGDRLAYYIGGGALEFGTRARYGAIHNEGGEISIAARSQRIFLKHRDGVVSPRFVAKRRANFSQWVTLPAYTITMPARPWLGLSAADHTEIARIVGDHIAGLFEGDRL